MNGLTVSSVAKQAKVNIETLRYYERRKVLPKPSRTESNYRLYSEDTVQKLRLIKRAQDLGFSLEEIKVLLSLKASPRDRCDRVYRQAKDKVNDIDGKIKTLQRMRKALSKLMSECTSRETVTECPILDALDAGVSG